MGSKCEIHSPWQGRRGGRMRWPTSSCDEDQHSEETKMDAGVRTCVFLFVQSETWDCEVLLPMVLSTPN